MSNDLNLSKYTFHLSFINLLSKSTNTCISEKRLTALKKKIFTDELERQQQSLLKLISGNFEHGTVIRTGITCRKIPCYMRDSACRWCIVKKTKIFWSYLKHFWILPGVRNCRILIGILIEKIKVSYKVWLF